MTVLAAITHIALSATMLQPEVELTVLPGGGSYVRAGMMAPFEVIVQNGENDYHGRVRLTLPAGYLDAETSVVRDLTLPPFALKRVFLYAPIAGQAPPEFEASYEDQDGEVIGRVSEPLRTTEPLAPIVCGVPALPAGLPPPQDAKGRTRYERLLIDPQHLPDQVEGYEMFDAIIFMPPPAWALDTARVTALRRWVVMGGILVVDASQRADGLRGGPLRDLLPFVPAGTGTAEISFLEGQLTIAEGPHTDCDVLLEDQGRPLVMRRRVGLGAVVCFALPMDAPPLNRWQGCTGLWQRVLEGIPSMETIIDRSAWAARNNVKAPAPLKPRIGLRAELVLLLMALYALAVGPGDYYLVKLSGRPWLTWITFPLLVAAFTLLAYHGARVWVGGGMVSAHTTCLAVFPQDGTAVQYDMARLFVPGGRRYSVSLTHGALPRPADLGAGPVEQMTVASGSGAIEHYIPVWSSRCYAAAAFPTPPPISLSLRSRDSVPVLRIANNSEMTLVQGTVFWRGNMWQAPAHTLAPGKKLEVTLAPGTARPYEQQSAAASDASESTSYSPARGLDEGTLLAQFKDAAPVRSPLVVDGERRPELGPREVRLYLRTGTAQ